MAGAIFGDLLSGPSTPLGSSSGTSGVGALADGGTQMVATDAVTFTKADGAPSATVAAQVSPSGMARRLAEYEARTESRSLSQQLFKITLDVDPADALGVPLATDDTATWRGLVLLVVGTAVPDASTGKFLVAAELLA